MPWRKVGAASLGLVGLVFFMQGLGLLNMFTSSMNNDIRWSIVGIGLIIAGLLFWPRETTKP